MYLSNEGILIILLVGLIAGWLAGKIVRGTGIGVIGDIAIGIVGAFIASWLLPQLGISVEARDNSGDHQCHLRRGSVADNYPARPGMTATTLSAAPHTSHFAMVVARSSRRRLTSPGQLGEVHRHAARFVLGQQAGGCSSPRLLFEIEIAERLPFLSRAMKQALFISSTVQGGGKRRAAGMEFPTLLQQLAGAFDLADAAIPQLGVEPRPDICHRELAPMTCPTGCAYPNNMVDML